MSKKGSRKVGKQKIIDGWLIDEDAYTAIRNEAIVFVQGRLFPTMWHFFFSFVSTVLPATDHTLVEVFMYLTALVVVSYGVPWLYRSVKHSSADWGARIAIIVVACGVALNYYQIVQLETAVADVQRIVANLQQRVGSLEKAMNEVQQRLTTLDNKVNGLATRVDTAYTTAMNNHKFIHDIDKFSGHVLSALTMNSISRRKLGLGCFAEGTLIQVDRFGTTVRIEDFLLGGHKFVYNPVLEKNVQIATFTHGPETGVMYQIVSNDSLSIVVTRTHPMVICDQSDAGFKCRNSPARDVKVNDWTVTVNGYHPIVSVKQVAVTEAMVYNMELALPKNISVKSRVLVANGMHTLDLYAQSMNEPEEK